MQEKYLIMVNFLKMLLVANVSATSFMSNKNHYMEQLTIVLFACLVQYELGGLFPLSLQQLLQTARGRSLAPRGTIK